MARYRLSEPARRDLDEIWYHIATENLQAADRLLDAILTRCAWLEEFPRLGKVRDDLRTGLRSIRVGNYLIFYKPGPDAVEIVRVLHGARNIEHLLKESQ